MSSTSIKNASYQAEKNSHHLHLYIYTYRQKPYLEIFQTLNVIIHRHNRKSHSNKDLPPPKVI